MAKANAKGQKAARSMSEMLTENERKAFDHILVAIGTRHEAVRVAMDISALKRQRERGELTHTEWWRLRKNLRNRLIEEGGAAIQDTAFERKLSELDLDDMARERVWLQVAAKLESIRFRKSNNHELLRTEGTVPALPKPEIRPDLMPREMPGTTLGSLK